MLCSTCLRCVGRSCSPLDFVRGEGLPYNQVHGMCELHLTAFLHGGWRCPFCGACCLAVTTA